MGCGVSKEGHGEGGQAQELPNMQQQQQAKRGSVKPSASSPKAQETQRGNGSEQLQLEDQGKVALPPTLANVSSPLPHDAEENDPVAYVMNCAEEKKHHLLLESAVPNVVCLPVFLPKSRQEKRRMVEFTLRLPQYLPSSSAVPAEATPVHEMPVVPEGAVLPAKDPTAPISLSLVEVSLLAEKTAQELAQKEKEEALARQTQIGSLQPIPENLSSGNLAATPLTTGAG